MSMSAVKTNLEKLGIQRKHPQEGDVFVLKLKPLDYYIFGKVISAKAFVWGLPAPNYLVYIYKAFSSSATETPVLHKDQLLIDGQMVNRQPWLKGYFKTVTHHPIQPEDRWEDQCFYSKNNKAYYSTDGVKQEQPGSPIFESGLGNHLTVEYYVCLALHIPLVPAD